MKFRLLTRAFLVAIPVFTVLTSISTVQIEGDSMLPTIKNNDIVRTIPATHYNRGEIVIADAGDHLVIKRLYGKEGDNIEIKDDKIMINEILVKNLSNSKGEYSKTLEKGEYFLVGDNPETEVFITNKLVGKVEKVISSESD